MRTMNKCLCTHSMHEAYVRRLAVVCALILHVDSEIAAADWFAEARGFCRRLKPRIRNTYRHGCAIVHYLKRVIVTGYS